MLDRSRTGALCSRRRLLRCFQASSELLGDLSVDFVSKLLPEIVAVGACLKLHVTAVIGSCKKIAQVIRGTFQIVAVDSTRRNMQLPFQFWSQRRPVFSQQVQNVLLPPMSGHFGVDSPGQQIHERPWLAV